MSSNEDTLKEFTADFKVLVKVKFKDFENSKCNNLAVQQIKTWIKEVLEEEDQVPLFVTSVSGEETTHKQVFVSLESINGVKGQVG